MFIGKWKGVILENQAKLEDRAFSFDIYILGAIYSQQRNNELDTNSADGKRTRNKQKRDVFSTLRPFKLMLSSECDWQSESNFSNILRGLTCLHSDRR